MLLSCLQNVNQKEKRDWRGQWKILRKNVLLSNSLFEKPRLGTLCPTTGLREKSLVRRDSVRKSGEAGSLVLDKVRKKQALTSTEKYAHIYLHQ